MGFPLKPVGTLEAYLLKRRVSWVQLLQPRPPRSLRWPRGSATGKQCFCQVSNGVREEEAVQPLGEPGWLGQYAQLSCCLLQP